MKLYEHPVKHQAGTFGNVVLSTAGIYAMRVGGTSMSCPQDWAAKIHHEEQKAISQPTSIRGINPGILKGFKAACIMEEIAYGVKLNELMREYLEKNYPDLIDRDREG